jgi:hypothetical protein
LPGLTRQSMLRLRFGVRPLMLAKPVVGMDTRVKPAYDKPQCP